MKRLALILMIGAAALTGCGKKIPQGKLVYTLTYDLPDSLRTYQDYLPKEAVVYFKGDSSVTIQQTGDESTTIIMHGPTNYMQVLLASAKKHYAINYSKQDQDDERANMPVFTAKKGSTTKAIAGYEAQQYTLTDKMTADSHEAWFSSAVQLPKNALGLVFDAALGTPFSFSTNQNGMITHTAIKSVDLKTDVPAGVFSAPANYEKLTPQQLKDMPVE